MATVKTQEVSAVNKPPPIPRRLIAAAPVIAPPIHKPTISVAIPPTVPPRLGSVKRDGKPQTQQSLPNNAKQQEVTAASEMTEEDWKIFRQHLFPIQKKREMFQCLICQRSVDIELETFPLACSHRFCHLCLVDHIERRFNYQGQVRCPTGKACQKYMEDEEVQKILGEKFPDFLRKVMKMLQEEANKVKQEKHIEDEKKIEEMVFVANKDEFECKICYVETAPGDGVTIKSCRHSFCKECLIEYIKASEDIDIKCPYNGDEGNCDKFLTEREMRGFLPIEILDKHLLKSLTLYETTSKTLHCLKPDCPGFVEADDNVPGFMCIVCSEVNCIRCEAIHTNKTCVEFEDIVNPDGRRKRLSAEADEAFIKYVAEGKAMHCPQCRLAIVKEDGCDFLQCPSCKLGICWVTKKPRKPLTRSDGTFIDGCHCREQGDNIRCHPNCGFCH